MYGYTVRVMGAVMAVGPTDIRPARAQVTLQCGSIALVIVGVGFALVVDGHGAPPVSGRATGVGSGVAVGDGAGVGVGVA